MSRFHSQTLAVAVATAVLLPCATAPAQNSKVVPPSATTTEGDGFNYMPFLYNAARTQQVWLGSAVTAGAGVLNGVNFRWNGNQNSYPAFSLNTHQVTIGHTSVSPATMSTTYASNITSTMTTVHNGKFSVAAAKGGIPAPFNINYPLSTPFLYTTAKGNLLIEWIVGSGNATSKGGPSLDAVKSTTGSSGAVRPFGTWGKFAGNDPASWKADAQKLVPGGSANISLGGFNQAYTAKLFVGLSDKSWNSITLPYDLGAIGAPGNNLYTGLEAIIPFTLTKVSNTSYGANPVFPLPNDNQLIGFKAFLQTYYADAKANAAGLVASDAMELTIGSQGPISKLMGTSSTTATRGSFWNDPPVVQFVGAIK